MKKALLLICLLSAPARAELDLHQYFLLEGESRTLVSSPLNPNNTIGLFPDQMARVESRSDLRANAGNFSLLLHPRARGERDRINQLSSSQASLFLQEGYLQWSILENLDLKVGRVQFGWGPAESITPTNWFAPLIQLEPSPRYEQLGIYRAQASWSVGQGFNWIVAQEIGAPRDSWNSKFDTVADTYRERLLTKAEWNWDRSNKIIGVVAGGLQETGGFGLRGGAYGSWNLNDAWQLYADTVFQKRKLESQWLALATAGFRYTFENGAEIRAEGIFNERGYSHGKQKAALELLAANPSLITRAYLLAARENLSGQEYGYLAFRWTNPGFFPSFFQTPSVSFRALHSFTDDSQVVLAYLEGGFLDRFNASLYGGLFNGRDRTELHLLSDNLLGFSLSYSL